MLAGQPGRLRLASPGAGLVTLAEGLITPTGLAVDQRSGEVFITHLGPGILTRLNVAGLIPRAPPTSMLPVVASAPGAFGSKFSTSAQISNPHPFPISGQIVFHPQGAIGAATDAIVFSVEQGSAIVYGSSAGNSGKGLTLQVAMPSSDM